MGKVGFRKGLKADLVEALEGIQTAGSFAHFGSIPDADFVQPEIAVRDVGPIRLPLDEEQARLLIGKARQAPFGRGAETITDTSVRNTWELDTGAFEFKNPGWNPFVEKLCGTVRERLGIESSISAQLYKMLIYERGAMFKAHTDSEKAPHMFGTLVICLPSAHEGGDVVLKHSKKTMTFESSAAEQSFACWYSDVSHEVLPATSGYRWVLTYNLVMPFGAPRPPVGLAELGNRQLRHILRKWLSHCAETPGTQDDDTDICSDHFYFGLEHEYTETSISMRSLKSVDRIRIQALCDLSEHLPIDIFLTVLEKRVWNDVSGGFDNYEDYHYSRHHDDEDEDGEDEEDDESEELGSPPSSTAEHIETTYCIKTLVDPTGRALATDLDMDEDDAAVIVRRDATASFLLGPRSASVDRYAYKPEQSPNFSDVISYYVDMASEPSRRTRGILGLKSLLDHVTDGTSMTKLLTAVLNLEEWDLFNIVAKRLGTPHVKGSLDPTLFDSIYHTIGLNPEPFAKAKDGITRAALSMPHLKDQLLAIAAVAPTQERCPDHLLTWARNLLNRALTYSKSVTLRGVDGEDVIRCVKAYYDVTFLTKVMIPIFNAKFRQTAFSLVLLNEFYRYLEGQGLLESDLLQTWKHIALTTIGATSFSSLRGQELSRPVKVARVFLSQESPPTVSPMLIKADVLAEFMGCLLDSRLGDEVARNLSLNLVQGASQIPPSEFNILWVPFLQKLVPVLETRSISLSTPHMQQIFAAILESYVDRYVGKAPPRATDLVRPCTEPCGCADCDSLNAFLRDPVQTVGRFQMGERRRKHVEMRLWMSNADCARATETSGRPHTLVITKTFKENDRELKEWATRKAEAVQMFKRFNQGKLKTLLGGDYDRLSRVECSGNGSGGPAAAGVITRPVHPTTSSHRVLGRIMSSTSVLNSGSHSFQPPLSAVFESIRPTSFQPPQPAGLQTPQPATGVKRKADSVDIDLTGDD